MHSVGGNKGLSYLEVVKLAIKGLFQDENKRKCGFEVKKFVGIKKSIYICTRILHNACKWGYGPFVYRLGRKIFILERGVRFSYGLQLKNNKEQL